MSKTLTIGMVAGEPSGDNLGAPLIKSLRQLHPDVHIVGIGGPGMVAEGMESWVDMDRLSVNGIIDPLLRLPELLKILKSTGDRLIKAQPAVFVGVDFNFFNLLLEERLRKAGIRTVHYVSPSVWAWRRGRLKKIGRSVDLMMTLYPFETAVYTEHGIRACYVGHPKADEIDPEMGQREKETCRKHFGFNPSDTVLAVLPGSRGSEVGLSLPDFMETCRLCLNRKANLKIIIPAANQARFQQISKILSEGYPDLDCIVVDGGSQKAMLAADFVLVNSGTATLEAMLLRRPMVMSYRMGRVSYALVSRMLKISRFALPNILAGEDLVPEFIQDRAKPELMAESVLQGMAQGNQTLLMQKFDELHHQLRQDAARSAGLAVLAEAGVTTLQVTHVPD